MASSAASEVYILIWYDLIYLLTAFGLAPGGSSTIQIYTQFKEQHNETEYTEKHIHNNKNT